MAGSDAVKKIFQFKLEQKMLVNRICGMNHVYEPVIVLWSVTDVLLKPPVTQIHRTALASGQRYSLLKVLSKPAKPWASRSDSKRHLACVWETPQTLTQNVKSCVDGFRVLCVLCYSQVRYQNSTWRILTGFNEFIYRISLFVRFGG